MRILIQRVQEASVWIEQKCYTQIGKGLLVYLGVEKDDKEEQASWLTQKLSHLRVFSDENKKMNLSIRDVEGAILVISQFTLCANCQQGRRPDFFQSAQADLALHLYQFFIQELKKDVKFVEQGKFAANMQIQSINDGPATFFLEK